MYALETIINNRRLVNLELETDSGAPNKNYIVEIPALIPFDLIRFKKKEFIKAFSMGDKDIALLNCVFSAKLENNKITISIGDSDNPTPQFIEEPKAEKIISYEDLDDLEIEDAAPVIEEDIPADTTIESLGTLENAINIFFKEDDNSFSLQAKCVKELMHFSLSEAKLTVEVVYTPTNIRNSFTLYLAHPNQFLGVALDFGSEASQMAVKRYSNEANMQEKKPEIENLYRSMYAYHVTKHYVPRDNTIEYYQEDKNTKFYKSLFFVKKELVGDYDEQRKMKSLCEAQTNIKMMVNKKGTDNEAGGISSLIQKYHQLPNLKIVHQHHDILSSLHFDMDSKRGQAELSLGDVKSIFNNTILRTMIASFLHTDYIKYPDEKRFLRLVILVPNIYDNNDVQAVRQNLDELLAELKRDEFPQLDCWEVTTISESDASFIGYLGKNNHNVTPGKDYMIIDVGKGTTDFSIVRTGKDSINNIEPIYRNGFAGGGNLITFSVFETLLHFLREQCNPNENIIKYLQDKIVQTLEGDDLLNKTLFYNEIERLKFNFRTGNPENIYDRWTKAKVADTTFANLIENNIDFSEFIKLLQELTFGADFYNYVQEACNAIIEKTVAYLKLVSENKKDFDLAGILLTGRTFLFKPLADAMHERLIKEFGVTEQQIHQLEGTELKDICIKGVFNNSVKLNTDVTGYPIQLIKTTESEKETVVEKVKKKWSLKAMILNDLERFSKSEKHIIADHKLNSDKLQQSQILIGSKYYSIVDNGLKGSEAVTEIDFTSKGYMIRQLQNGVVKNITALNEIHDYDAINLELIVPSLFPTYMDEQYIYSLQRDEVTSKWVNPSAPKTEAPIMSTPPSAAEATVTPPPFNESDNPLLF